MPENIYASVDLGGTKIACAFASAGGRLLCEEKIPTRSHEGPTAVLDRIASLVNDLAARIKQKPVALGLGVPGLIDLSSGVTKFFPNLPTNWRDVPLRNHLEPLVGCPVYALNDARLATLGEMTYGLGREVNTMAYFTLGTGIGGGLMVNKQLHLGPMGAAGELGHQTILPDGPLCGCGNRGCIETVASGPAITAQGVWLMNCGRAARLYELVSGDITRVTPKEMAAAAMAGDEAVRDVLVRAFEYLGIGVCNVIVSLLPDLVVFGGGMVDVGPLLFDTVRRVVRGRVGMFPTEHIRIEPSSLGEKAGMWGGIALAAGNNL